MILASSAYSMCMLRQTGDEVAHASQALAFIIRPSSL
jgi:hypothetical protein